MKKILPIAILLFLFSIYLLPFAKAIDISQCLFPLTENETYVLTKNITLNCVTGVCFIPANNVVIDLNGHTVSISGSNCNFINTDLAGSTTNNLTIKNGKVFVDSGYFVAGVSNPITNLKVENVEVSANPITIWINGNYGYIKNSKLTATLHGVRIGPEGNYWTTSCTEFYGGTCGNCYDIWTEGNHNRIRGKYDYIYNTGSNNTFTYEDCYSPVTCFDINTSGTYTLTDDIYATKDPCIVINSSDVVLDLNGHTIQGRSGMTWGIASQPSVPIPFTNITIKNGKIDSFSEYGIIFSYVNDSVLDNLEITRSRYGIRLFQGNGINITNSAIWNNQYGVRIDGVSKNFYVGNNWFYNAITDFDVSAGALWNSWIIKNQFGNVSVNLTCCTNTTIRVFPFPPFNVTTCLIPCNRYYDGAVRNFDCYSCEYNDFVGNFYYAIDQDATHKSAMNNRFIKETYGRYPETQSNGLFLDSSSKNNWGCGIQGYVFDSGVNNTFVADCPSTLYPNETTRYCLEEFICIDSKTVGYKMPDCSVSIVTVCKDLCSNGKCVSIPTQAPTEISPFQPAVNTTPFAEVGAGWLAPFFTPFFFVTIFILGISAMVTKKVTEYGGGEYAGAVFLGSLLLLVIYLTVSGFYPAWIGIVFIIIAGFLFAKFVIGLI
jgi:hypothetical protein